MIDDALFAAVRMAGGEAQRFPLTPGQAPVRLVGIEVPANDGWVGETLRLSGRVASRKRNSLNPRMHTKWTAYSGSKRHSMNNSETWAYLSGGGTDG